MAKVFSIGPPENESERKAINYLKEHLPDNYVLFTNLELPTRGGLPYEYDIIVVGGHAVYYVEVKGYRGEIKGNAFEWELASGVIYKSPLPLANKKAKILGERIRSFKSSLGRVWVQSVILLSDDQVKVRLNDPQASRVLHLKEAVAYLQDPRQIQVSTESIEHLKPTIMDAISGQFKPLHRSNEIGDYRVIETIGKNDLYTSLLSQHKLLQLNNHFVLKVYSVNVYDSPEAQEKQRDWILRDATALLQLNYHKNIVRAYPPFAWLDNQIVLPVEWVEGFSLAGLLSANEVMTLQTKAAIMQQLFEAIKFSHENNVIHRDIRPKNIIIPKSGPVKIINFDCAHFEEKKLHTIATRVGKHLDEKYVAPEVWIDPGCATPASDIYALGIVFFEMLVGRPPYQKMREVFEKRGLPVLPTQVDSSLPPKIDEIISGMCAFNFNERRKLGEVMETIKEVSKVSEGSEVS